MKLSAPGFVWNFSIFPIQFLPFQVLTIHWVLSSKLCRFSSPKVTALQFVTFPNAGDNLAAYHRYRDHLNGFWAEKTVESDINFIPHKFEQYTLKAF